MPSTHSPAARKLFRTIRTPLQAQKWLGTLQYNPLDTMYGLAGVVRRGQAHCLEASLSVATLLEQRDYPPLILDLESKDDLDHTLFLYKKNGKFGTVGMSRDVGLNGRKPVFKTIRSLVQSYTIPYIDAKAEVIGYGVFDLRTLQNTSWRTTRKEVWFVEEAMKENDHVAFRSPRGLVQKWRKKYLAFKKEFPDRQPDYFPGQRSWI